MCPFVCSVCPFACSVCPFARSCCPFACSLCPLKPVAFNTFYLQDLEFSTLRVHDVGFGGYSFLETIATSAEYHISTPNQKHQMQCAAPQLCTPLHAHTHTQNRCRTYLKKLAPVTASAKHCHAHHTHEQQQQKASRGSATRSSASTSRATMPATSAPDTKGGTDMPSSIAGESANLTGSLQRSVEGSLKGSLEGSLQQPTLQQPTLRLSPHARTLTILHSIIGKLFLAGLFSDPKLLKVIFMHRCMCTCEVRRRCIK